MTSPALIEKTRSTVTDGNGRYHIQRLPIGTHGAITVMNLPASIDILQAEHSIQSLGDSVALSVTIRNARGDALPATAVTCWSTVSG